MARNDAPFDAWSLIHFGAAVVLTWLLGPLAALFIVVAWEPLEVLVLSRLAARWFKIEFGNEGRVNILFDLIMDMAGVAFGAWILPAPWG